jgi:hypothetical protein
MFSRNIRGAPTEAALLRRSQPYIGKPFGHVRGGIRLTGLSKKLFALFADRQSISLFA